MQLVRLKGVKQDKKGTVYQMTHVESDGDAISEETAPDFFEFAELATPPAAPAANMAILYCEDNGAGKTRLVAKFASGANVVLATQA